MFKNSLELDKKYKNIPPSFLMKYGIEREISIFPEKLPIALNEFEIYPDQAQFLRRWEALLVPEF